MRLFHRVTMVLLGFMFFFPSNAMAQDGATLYKQNCAACHKLDKRFIGPPLSGINEKRSEQWLLAFIKSSQTLVKSGDKDAVAIFEAYNGTIMNDFDLSNTEIKTILNYIQEQTPKETEQTKEEKIVEVIPIEYTEEDINIGKELFLGQKRFKERGASCLSCHHVSGDNLYHGGLLAKDLTKAFDRLGDEGIRGILTSSPYPVMAIAYEDQPLDSVEIAQLTAFLKHSNSKKTADDINKNSASIFLLGGFSGLTVLFLFFAFNWSGRLKNPINHRIYNR